MPDNGELHDIFGTGAMGMSVMDELVQRGPRRVRRCRWSRPRLRAEALVPGEGA
jgi:hypothetical protein